MKLAAVLCIFIALFGASIALKDAICGLPPAGDGIGLMRCFALIPSWTYYTEDNACKQFNYGGCGGNLNRFATLEDCEGKCKEWNYVNL